VASYGQQIASRGADVREQRRKRAAHLRLLGMPQAEIAQRLGVSTMQISRDLAVARDEWKAQYAKSYDEHVTEQLAHYDLLLNALRVDIEMGVTEAIKEARLLAERRARLLGLDSPIRHEVTHISLEALDQEIGRLEQQVVAGEVLSVTDDLI